MKHHPDNIAVLTRLDPPSTTRPKLNSKTGTILITPDIFILLIHLLELLAFSTMVTLLTILPSEQLCGIPTVQVRISKHFPCMTMSTPTIKEELLSQPAVHPIHPTKILA